MGAIGLGTLKNPPPIFVKPVRYDFIRTDVPLSEKQRKYCRCLLRVEDKRSKGLSKARSPYALCTSTIGTQIRSCSQYYDWRVMDSDMLRAYLTLHKLHPIEPATRESLLQQIRHWKISKGY